MRLDFDVKPATGKLPKAGVLSELTTILPEPVREGRFEELSLRSPTKRHRFANESRRKRFLAKLVLDTPHRTRSTSSLPLPGVGDLACVTRVLAATTRLPQAGRTRTLSPKYWRVIRLLPMSGMSCVGIELSTLVKRALSSGSRASSAASVAGLLSRIAHTARASYGADNVHSP